MTQLPAQKQDDHIVVVNPHTGAERHYKRIIAALAYGDWTQTDAKVAHPALVLAGEQTDGRFRIIREFQSPYDALKAEMIRLKDVFLASIFYVPGENKTLILDLWETDGLCKYKHKLKAGRKGNPVYEVQHPHTVWPSFRNWKVLAQVIALPDRLTTDFDTAEILAGRLAREGALVWQGIIVPGLDGIMNDAPAARRESPLYRAYVSVVWMLWETSQQRRHEASEETPRFPWEAYYREER